MPWQTNNTFIIVMFYSFLPGNALICKGSEDFIKLLFICQLGKSRQDLASCDYLLVVKLVVKGDGLLLRGFLFCRCNNF